MAAAPAAEFEVLADAWPVFVLFSRVPWRRSLWDNTALGIDWHQAESLCRAFKVVWDTQAVDDLQALEEGALDGA